MSKAASKKQSTSTLPQKIEAATKLVREADHRQNLLEARTRGAKASAKAAKKAFKLAKKALRKAVKAARKAHKQLGALVKEANKRPAKVKAKAARKRPVRKPVSAAV